MGRLFGVVRFDGHPVSRATLEAMGSALAADPVPTAAVPRPRTANVLVDGAIGLGYVRLAGRGRDEGDEGGPLPYRHAATGVLVTGEVHLYDRDGLVRSLERHQGAASAIPDGQLLVEAFLRWGEDFPARVRGDFALAVWDPRDRSLLLVRDHLGCAPLFHARVGATVLFASDLNGVLAALHAPPDLDPEWIPALLTGDQSDPERTPYSGVRRALAGHVHRVVDSGERRSRYWDLDPGVEIVLSSDGEYEEAFRARLEDAVRVRLPGGVEPVGSELSGGLDSSAVTALAHAAARGRGTPFLSFAHVLPDPLLGLVWPHEDEREWAERLRLHARVDRHVSVDADGYPVLDSLRRAIRLHAAPSIDGFHVLSDALHDRARAHGVATLFSGFGGDEMVSSPASLALEGWILRGDGRHLLRELLGRDGRSAAASRLSLVRSWARLRLAPLLRGPGRKRQRALTHGEDVARAVVDRLPVLAAHAERWALHDRAMAEWRTIADATEGSDVRAYERYRVLRGATAQRLESSNVAAGACGIGYRYPLLDVALLEFYHAVPPDQKWRAGWGRFLFRRSVAGLVPDPLRWRADKQGVTIPNGLARFHGAGGDVREVLARAKRRPELEFLDFGKLDRWADALLESAAGNGARGAEGLRVGRFNKVLALALYYDLRDEGWHPGRPSVPLAVTDVHAPRPSA